MIEDRHVAVPHRVDQVARGLRRLAQVRGRRSVSERAERELEMARELLALHQPAAAHRDRRGDNDDAWDWLGQNHIR
ncbi:hypothetical protein [Salipiger thiooxidans]|uniref:hypothetical protein n=1 Tax=Salipiger thiooxidans TaxID=282683 RepID=UPI001CFC12FD|nr:hypothetical protein [Salipiger thiooxidans]